MTDQNDNTTPAGQGIDLSSVDLSKLGVETPVGTDADPATGLVDPGAALTSPANVTPITAAPSLREVEVGNVTGYVKFLVPLVTAILTVFAQLLGHGNALFILLSVLVAAAQAYSSYKASNAEAGFWKYAKGYVNAIGVAAQAVLAIVGTNGSLADVTGAQWATIGLSVLATVGVIVLPNGAATELRILPAAPADDDEPKHIAA